MIRSDFLKLTLLAPLARLLPKPKVVPGEGYGAKPVFPELVKANPLSHTGPRDWWPEFQMSISQTWDAVTVDLVGDEDCDEYSVSGGGYESTKRGRMCRFDIASDQYDISGVVMEVTATHEKSGATTTARFMVDSDFDDMQVWGHGGAVIVEGSNPMDMI